MLVASITHVPENRFSLKPNIGNLMAASFNFPTKSLIVRADAMGSWCYDTDDVFYSSVGRCNIYVILYHVSNVNC